MSGKSDRVRLAQLKLRAMAVMQPLSEKLGPENLSSISPTELEVNLNYNHEIQVLATVIGDDFTRNTATELEETLLGLCNTLGYGWDIVDGPTPQSLSVFVVREHVHG